MTRRIRHRIVTAVAVIIACFAISAVAQTETGTVSGRVLDSSGAAVPGAIVSVRDLGTNAVRRVKTNGSGGFEAPLLPPSSYEISATMSGFKTSAVPAFKLDIDAHLDLNITLVAGAVQESVTVSAIEPLLNSTNSTIGQVIDNQKIVDLPLANRNILELNILVPGVQDYGATVAPATSGSVQFGRYTANGGPTNTNEYMLDGASSVVANLNASGVIPTIDAIRETKIQTGNMPAEFGRTGGSVFNATYKSGTNDFHGSVWEFWKNRVLNANTPVNRLTGTARQFNNINTFGASINGPIRIPHIYNGTDKLFFLFSYEGYRDVTPVSALLTVPTVKQKSGDFSDTKDASGNQVNIYDPNTIHLSGASYVRNQFPGNVIPSARLNQTAVKMLSYYPNPNTAPSNAFTNANNYHAVTSAYNTQEEYTIKIDYYLSARNHLFGHYVQSAQGGGNANYFGSTPGCSECLVKNNPAGVYSPRGGGAALLVLPKLSAIGLTHIFSSRTLLDLRLATVRNLLERVPQAAGFDLADIGMNFNNPQTAASARIFPTTSITNFQNLGVDGDLLVRGDNTLVSNASLTLIRGSHSIKIGGDFRIFRYNELTGSQSTPIFGFDNSWTRQNPNTSTNTSGYSLASMLLGPPTSGSYTINAPVALQWFYGAVYMQDDWTVNPRLTLNLGLRWDAETPFTDRHNRTSVFDPSANSPATSVSPNVHGGLVFVGKDIPTRHRFSTDWNDWGPRVGGAYRFSNTGVFRAAYGILYQPIMTYGFANGAVYGQQGFSASTTMNGGNNTNAPPTNFIDKPFTGGINFPTGSSLGTGTFLGQVILTQEKNSGVVTPYVQHFSVGIEQQIGGTLLGIAYVGSHSVHQFANLALNQLSPQNMALGAVNPAYLTTQVPNPFYGLATGCSAVCSPTYQRGQSLRPFPQFAEVTDNYQSIGNTHYNALQTRIDRRLTKGLSVLASYTWSQQIGNVPERYYASGTGSNFQNSYNPSAERAISPLDATNTIRLAFSWALPFGRGQAVGNGMPRWADLLVGGWQLNSIYSKNTGQPLLIAVSTNQVGFGGVSRANRDYSRSPQIPASQRTLKRYFDTSVFSQPPTYTYGNSRPYDSDLRSAGNNTMNASIFKNFQFAERAQFQFRAEFFNVANHSLLANPNTTVGNAAFGQSASRTGNRTGQLSGKIIF